MNKLLLLLAAAAILCGSARAADAPLVRFPSGAAAWRVKVTHPNAAGTMPRVEKAEVTQSADGSRRTVLSWSNGTTTETWSSAKWPGLAAVESPAGAGIHVVPLSDALLRTHMVVSFDASLFSWIQRAFLQGEADFLGRRCLHYRGLAPLTAGDDSDETPAKVLHQAWIDIETLAPVALDDSSRMVAFSPLPAPQKNLVLPAIFQAALDRYQRALDLPKPLGSLR